ncbi:MAG: META domain-containing protein [Caulobacteraceae bacterium]
MRSVLLALVLLGACAQTPAAPPETPAAILLSGTKWQRVDDENANPHGATLEFTERGASGHTGCNRWFTAVTQDGEALSFGNIGMTRMACQTEIQAATERSFLAALRATRYAHYDQDALVLLDARRDQVARFVSTQ